MEKTVKTMLIIIVPVFIAFLALYARDAIFSGKLFSSSCVPQNHEILREGSSLKVSWQTEEFCSGYLLYNEVGSESKLVTFGDNGSEESKEHTVEVDGLDSNSEYEISVVSDKIEYGLQGKSITVSP